MEPIKKEAILAWVAKHDWFLLNEAGQQVVYLSPNGEVSIFTFDLQGNFQSIGKLMPPPPTPHRGIDLRGLDLKGGSPFSPL